MELDDLTHRFTLHPPKDDDQVKRYKKLREFFRQMSHIINQLCPDSREKSLAITKLEESAFWANASIARNE